MLGTENWSSLAVHLSTILPGELSQPEIIIILAESDIIN